MKLCDIDLKGLTTQEMFDIIIKYRKHNKVLDISLKHMNDDNALSVFVTIAFHALRGEEMWKDALKDIDSDITKRTNFKKENTNE